MKKLGILVIALALLVVGMAMAEPGIPKVNEVQGLAISTTVIAAGNFNQASSVQVDIIQGADPLTSVPPIEEGVMYTSVYTEDTQNSEVGFISYDKDLDVSTANKVSGQWNIQAVKQITYLGVDASSIITNDFLMVDGAGEDYGTLGSKLLCPFGSESQAPSFCNRVETGSNMNLKVANLNTQMGDRFIMKSADPGAPHGAPEMAVPPSVRRVVLGRKERLRGPVRVFWVSRGKNTPRRGMIQKGGTEPSVGKARQVGALFGGRRHAVGTSIPCGSRLGSR
jgi:hypothetical protein